MKNILFKMLSRWKTFVFPEKKDKSLTSLIYRVPHNSKS